MAPTNREIQLANAYFTRKFSYQELQHKTTEDLHEDKHYTVTDKGLHCQVEIADIYFLAGPLIITLTHEEVKEFARKEDVLMQKQFLEEAKNYMESTVMATRVSAWKEKCKAETLQTAAAFFKTAKPLGSDVAELSEQEFEAASNYIEKHGAKEFQNKTSRRLHDNMHFLLSREKGGFQIKAVDVIFHAGVDNSPIVINLTPKEIRELAYKHIHASLYVFQS